MYRRHAHHHDMLHVEKRFTYSAIYKGQTQEMGSADALQLVEDGTRIHGSYNRRCLESHLHRGGDYGEAPAVIYRTYLLVAAAGTHGSL